MGLDTTHNCWHGPYGAFHNWRCKLAEVAGLPNLELMDGFWDVLKYDPLHLLLRHSDCDGVIPWAQCGEIADSMEKLLPLLCNEERWKWLDLTQQFINGLRLANSKQEDVEFH